MWKLSSIWASQSRQKNCSFTPTLEDLSIQANHATVALNNKIELSKLPMRLLVNIFNYQIVPILLYGSEVWGPCIDVFTSWGKTNVGCTLTQYLKRILGCNIMMSVEIGARPLLTQVIKRVILYLTDVKKHHSSIVWNPKQYYTKFLFIPWQILPRWE